MRRRNTYGVAAATSAAVAVVGLLWSLWPRIEPPTYDGKALRWGGDAGGGAPYILEHGPNRAPSGFEGELAADLAARLGIPARFVQKDWDMLPSDLARGDIDVLLNGYEWSPQRERKMASTLPYYIYRLQLIVAPGSSMRDWDDLRRARSGRQLKVGVLSDSAAHLYLKKNYAPSELTIVALSVEGSTGLMSMVRNGTLDATVQDNLAAIYYIQQGHGFADLRIVGPSIEPGYFVLYVRPNDGELRLHLNEALRAALRDGTLRRIYAKYGLWNADQDGLPQAMEDWPPPMPESEQTFADFLVLLVRAAGVTILLACGAMPLAMLLGLFVALGRFYGPRGLSWILTVYVELLRGTPVLMQLFVIYYLLPAIGVKMEAFWAGMLGLAINYSAYEAENYRAGLLAIPRGQMEAALSLGMSLPTALWRILVPQAVRLVVPPVTNDFISLFKDTSVCSVIAVVELTSSYRSLMVNYPQYMLQLGFVTALLYLLMSYPLSLAARRLERRQR